MRKNHTLSLSSSSKTKWWHFLMLTTFVVMNLSVVVAQSEKENHTVIYLNGQLNSLSVGDEDSWSMLNGTTGQSFSGKGASVYENKFDVPGTYTLRTTHTDVCGHEHGAQENSMKIITVLPYKVTFLFDEISFSKPLEESTSFDEETVTVPFILERFDNSDIAFPEFSIRASGVGAKMTGRAKEGQTFKAGRNTLMFTLSGSLKSNTYVSLHFIDNVNGIIQPFYYPLKIK
ncbi:MAG TPA: hypothetical protein PLP27_02100 [Crocinitomicaceae bacterium]|nr:hypothetical protein [Crocinitomicaceae bacterium]